MLPVYWDLLDQDERRLEMDRHIRSCPACREEFEIWRESTELIRTTILEEQSPQETPAAKTMSDMVMKRIYEEEPWRLPVTERIYQFSYAVRRNFMVSVAFCLSLFVFGFLYSLVYPSTGDGFASESIDYGLQPVASASGESGAAMQSFKLTASILPQEPFMLKNGLIQSYPDYLLVLSLLGLTCTLLIMNWLSRTRA